MIAAWGWPRESIDWQPFAGCSIASPGCLNCHAMKTDPHGLTVDSGDGPIWTGRLQLLEDEIDAPRRQGKPAMISTCTRSDLFHKSAPDAWLDRIFDAIEDAPQHVYQVLTKRADRMRAYLAGRYPGRPPHNLYVGVSAERQREAEERIPLLLAAPAAGRFVVFYPLLGPIDVAVALPNYVPGSIVAAGIGDEPQRPMRQEWASTLRAQLEARGISCGPAGPDLR
jgi:protein gp37